MTMLASDDVFPVVVYMVLNSNFDKLYMNIEYF